MKQRRCQQVSGGRQCGRPDGHPGRHAFHTVKWEAPKPAATRRGPPRKSETRGERFGGMRLSADELALIERAAKIANRKPGDFVRVAALKVARELVAGREFLERPEPPPNAGAFSSVEYLEAVLSTLEPEATDGPSMVAAKARQARDVREQLDRARERATSHGDLNPMPPRELVNGPETAEPAQGGGRVASKSMVRRLAMTGGPPPACTCDPAARESKTGRPFNPERAIDHGVECPRRTYLATLAV